MFRQVGWKTFEDRDLAALLRQAVGNSLKKHYHGGKGIDVLSPEGTLPIQYMYMYNYYM